MFQKLVYDRAFDSWFTGINYYKLAVEKDRDSIFTTITTIWKPGFKFRVSRPNFNSKHPSISSLAGIVVTTAITIFSIYKMAR
jgi:hypothetical protein